MRLPAAHRAFQRTLAFVLLVLAAGLAVAGDPGDLHVATYNLRLDVASDGANASTASMCSAPRKRCRGSLPTSTR
jgi:hypothetical protein